MICDIDEGPVVDCAGLRLRFAPPDEVVVEGGERVIRQSVPSLAEGWYVAVRAGAGGVVFIGEKGPDLWVARVEGPELVRITTVERLDLGGYDPGGFHFADFHDLPDGDALLVYELGVVRLGPAGELRWSAAHEQFGMRLAKVTARQVVLCGDDWDDLAVDLATGRSTTV